jgi:hypothetical protein
MKDKQSIDELITQVLSEEEAEFYHKLDQQDLPEMISGLYQGKLKWLTILTTIIMVFLFAGALFCLFKFFNASSATEMISWSFCVFFGFIAIGFLKLMNLLQIYSNKISREMKRLEFQISVLSSKIQNND